MSFLDPVFILLVTFYIISQLDIRSHFLSYKFYLAPKPEGLRD